MSNPAHHSGLQPERPPRAPSVWTNVRLPGVEPGMPGAAALQAAERPVAHKALGVIGRSRTEPSRDHDPDPSHDGNDHHVARTRITYGSVGTAGLEPASPSSQMRWLSRLPTSRYPGDGGPGDHVCFRCGVVNVLLDVLCYSTDGRGRTSGLRVWNPGHRRGSSAHMQL